MEAVSKKVADRFFFNCPWELFNRHDIVTLMYGITPGLQPISAIRGALAMEIDETY